MEFVQFLVEALLVGFGPLSSGYAADELPGLAYTERQMCLPILANHKIMIVIWFLFTDHYNPDPFQRSLQIMLGQSLCDWRAERSLLLLPLHNADHPSGLRDTAQFAERLVQIRNLVQHEGAQRAIHGTVRKRNRLGGALKRLNIGQTLVLSALL